MWLEEFTGCVAAAEAFPVSLYNDGTAVGYGRAAEEVEIVL